MQLVGGGPELGAWNLSNAVSLSETSSGEAYVPARGREREVGCRCTLFHMKVFISLAHVYGGVQDGGGGASPQR